MCGARAGRRGGRLATHRAPRPLTAPDRPVERAVNAAPVLCALAGPGRIREVIRTSVRWLL
ncbi:morphogenic membrane protein MmpA [Streptomyces sp. NPDC003273]|uniref:morphogenic membrane protein MmpA n=1 Tax=Streptomyces sp. NPDC003273 TaxID=3364678 RepID=UPI0036A563FD